jgi:hypothetical protein
MVQADTVMLSYTRHGTWMLDGKELRDGDFVEFRTRTDWRPAIVIAGGCAVEPIGAADPSPGHQCADPRENLTLVTIMKRRIEIRRVPRAWDVRT